MNKEHALTPSSLVASSTSQHCQQN